MKKVCPQCRADFAPEMDVCPADGTRLVDAAPLGDPFVGQILADRYRVIRTLGEGGMGRVYLAEHVRMGRLSAVKVMSPALKPTAEAIGRFNREAANASRINQPNVAAIYDFGETEDGTLYLAMEYVEGETLAALLRRGGPLAPQRAAELTAQIADALAAAHRLGIVHRDLKPDNILVTTRDDGRDWAKVVDFGIAKTTAPDSNQTVTSLGMSIGTPEYMSPEQIAGEPLDARTDLYSLGLVLFNMLTGLLPHPAMTSKQSLVQRLTARPRTLAEVRPNIPWPPRLQKALDRALAPEPDDRYGSVGDFARDVRGAVGMAGFAGAAAIASAVTRAMTPISVDALPPRTPAARPAPSGTAAARKKGGKGPLVAALLLLSAGTALALRPPRALQAFMEAKGIATRSAGTQPASVDSLARASVASASVSAPAAPESAKATADPARTPIGDSLSPVDAGLRLRSAAMRTTGDSSDAGHPALMESADVYAREITFYVNRARDLARTRELKGAGKDLQTAFEEYRIFLTEHAGAPQTDALRNALQGAMDEALSACNAVRDSLAARPGRKIRCQHPAKTGILVEELGDASAAPRAPAPLVTPAATPDSTRPER